MTAPRVQLLRRAWGRTALALLAVLLLNALSSVAFVRLDLTATHRHSLSQVARDSVAELAGPLVARVYFSEGLGAPYHDHRRALLDKLSELAVVAPHGLEIVVVDPAGDPDKVAEAGRLGVRPLPYAFRAWDRTEARTVWMGVVFEYGDRKVAVDALPTIAGMEVELVRAIRRVSAGPVDTRRVGWLLGHGEPDPTQAAPGSPLTQVVEGLRASGVVRTLAPGDSTIPEDLDVLMIVAPRRPLSPAEVVHLDQYLMGGGTVLAWLSTLQPDFDAGVPVAVDHGLSAWLAHLGVVVRSEALLDRDHAEQMVVPMELEGRGRALVRLTYPLALITTNLDRGERTMRDLTQLLLPFASPLAVSEALADDVDARVWARTMPSAVAVPGLATLDPRAVRQPQPGEVAGAYPVVVALWGRFESAYAAGGLPPRLDPRAAPFERAQLVTRSRPTRVVVVGSGDALANNVEFAQNTVDWLVDDSALIAIRSRDAGEAPLMPPPRGAAARAKLLVVGLPLLMLVGIGALVWVGRPM